MFQLIIKENVMLVFSAITSHPPIIIPEIGAGDELQQVRNTINSMKELREELKKESPDTVIVVSPHASFHSDVFGINEANPLKGTMKHFGFSGEFKFENDMNLIKKIGEEAGKENIETNYFLGDLDHGSLVPLYYLASDNQFKLIHLSFASRSREEHLKFGKIIQKICKKTNEKIALIASGDLSHRLMPFAPAGYSPQGKIFDEQLINLLEEKNFQGVLGMNSQLIEEAGECGYRSILILMGAVGEDDFHFNKKSYEGPFGVGYLTARTS
ncbi:MAG: AmmeMemoRadiSam system protein B [Candidatus Moraniibacteriota bacterium]